MSRRQKYGTGANARELAEGVTISVRMTRAQHDLFVASMAAQNGPANNFVLRALMTGAAFLGQRREGKPRPTR